MSDAHFFISGNVTIHPSAAIAPGVMLQADPDSQLVIAAGVCIGIGCILHAHQGDLIVESGATLGSGVLVVGNGTIGANACIGSMTTILDRSVPPQQSVPPGSLIGDDSRNVVIVEASETFPSPEPSPTKPLGTPEPPDSAHSTSASSKGTTVRVVYGRTYLERMMITMFPHRQASDSPLPDEESG